MGIVQWITSWVNRIRGKFCADSSQKAGLCIFTDTINTVLNTKCGISANSNSEQEVEFGSKRGKIVYLFAHARPKSGLRVTSNEWIKNVYLRGSTSIPRSFEIEPDQSSNKEQTKLYIDIYESNSDVGPDVPNSDIPNQSHVYKHDTLEVTIDLN